MSVRSLIAGIAVAVVAGGAMPALGQNLLDLRPERETWIQDDWDERFYLSLSAGLTMPSDSSIDRLGGESIGSNTLELSNGFAANLGLGRYFQPFRVEGELGYRGTDIDRMRRGEGFSLDTDASNNLELFSFMANAYYDEQLMDGLDLYVGGGLGFARVRGWARFLDDDDDPVRFSGNDDVFAYQLMTGLAYQATDDIIITGGYRFFSHQDATFDDLRYDAPRYHTLELGLRYNF